MWEDLDLEFQHSDQIYWFVFLVWPFGQPSWLFSLWTVRIIYLVNSCGWEHFYLLCVPYEFIYLFVWWNYPCEVHTMERIVENVIYTTIPEEITKSHQRIASDDFCECLFAKYDCAFFKCFKFLPRHQVHFSFVNSTRAEVFLKESLSFRGVLYLLGWPNVKYVWKSAMCRTRYTIKTSLPLCVHMVKC